MSVTELLQEARNIQEKDPRARGEALEAVARRISVQGDSAVPELIAALTHSDGLISQTAGIALNRINTQSAFEAISPLLNSQNSRERTFALNWIQHHPRPESVPLLELLFNTSPHISVINKIITVLEQMEYPEALELWNEILDRDIPGVKSFKREQQARRAKENASNASIITRYIEILTADDPDIQADHSDELKEFKDEALPYLASHLTKHYTHSDTAIEKTIQTMLKIGSRVDLDKELLYFITDPDPKNDLWPDNVKVSARSALDQVGYQPADRITKYRATERRFLVFLLGVENADNRASAREIVALMLDDIHPEIFANALEDQSLCTNYDSAARLESRLGQKRHSRPHDVLSFLEEHDNDGKFLHYIACNPRTCWYTPTETRQAALESATKIGVDTSAWVIYTE